ncbi:hypothetical protein AB1Y20_016624 [Prymnesium parvum]|uniref:Uncharacterized protein n=1 Tax=Prymnesium parvum TaxID=97485 RepID=A0AB34IDB0_PRYPA
MLDQRSGICRGGRLSLTMPSSPLVMLLLLMEVVELRWLEMCVEMLLLLREEVLLLRSMDMELLRVEVLLELLLLLLLLLLEDEMLLLLLLELLELLLVLEPEARHASR